MTWLFRSLSTELPVRCGLLQYILHITIHSCDVFVVGLAQSVMSFVSGKGNISVSAEFNFYADPEAAYVVLNELGRISTFVSWELCLECDIGEVCKHRLNKKSIQCIYIGKAKGKFMIAGLLLSIIDSMCNMVGHPKPCSSH